MAAVAHLARNLRIDVVAEGIEDAGQADFLAKLGCVCGQGFSYAPPLAEEDVVAWADGRSTPRPGEAERAVRLATRNPSP